MQKEGRIIRWNAEKAFGFIQSHGSAGDVFFHLRDYRGSAPPRPGQTVWFEEIQVGGKGPRAMAVQTAPQAQSLPAKPHGTPSAQRISAPRARNHSHQAPATGAPLAYALLLVWAGLIAWGLWMQRLPLWTLAALAALNAVTLWSYAADKNAARNGGWRTPEAHLHGLALLGGWPAAWLAQQSMQHKSRKKAFRATYWGTIVLHCAALVFWLWKDAFQAIKNIA
jgi:uncharacterized membrane protein YsdA (DUF1294 family)/cold shock CspA family protein